MSDTIVIGLAITESDFKSRLIESFVPRIRMEVANPYDLWYNPNPTEEEINAGINQDRLSYLNNKAPESIPAYIDSVKQQIIYPYYWESMRIRLAVQEIFNIKVGSEGDNVVNRKKFQTLDCLLNLYSKLPGFSFKALVDIIEAISIVPTSYNAEMTTDWALRMEEMLCELDENVFFNNMKLQLRQLTSTFNNTVDDQWNLAEKDEFTPLLDRLPKQHCILVPDVSTEKEADYIRDTLNGIVLYDLDTNDIVSARVKIYDEIRNKLNA